MSASLFVEYGLPDIYTWYGYSPLTSTTSSDYFANIAVFSDVGCTTPYSSNEVV